MMITIYDGGLFWTMPPPAPLSLFLSLGPVKSVSLFAEFQLFRTTARRDGQADGAAGAGLMELKLTSIATSLWAPY